MASESFILFPPFRLDVRNEQLWRDNEVVPVRPKPFAVLAYLATHPDQLVTATELRKAIWPDTYVGEGVLRGYIREIRNVLGDDAERPRFIETIARRGYRFLPSTTTPPVNSEQLGVSSALPLTPSLLLTPHSSLLTPHSFVLVGRAIELTHLHQWLAKAANGTRQLVFVTGEPGIGKTTLVDAFLQSLGTKTRSQENEQRRAESKEQGAKIDTAFPAPSSKLPAPCYARGQCIEHYGAGEAYLPVLEALGQLCRQPGGEQIVNLLSRYAPTWLVQMPALVSDTEFEVLQRKVQGATRERMLREMTEALEALTAERPLVLVLEDIHWSDHSTLDLLSLLAQRRGPARLFVLATYRPADIVVSGHPLRALKQELQVHGQCEEVALRFLTAAEVTQYLRRRFPQHVFPFELGRIIHQSTEGNPLFMVNVVDEWVRQGVLCETDGHWQLAANLHELAAGVPESLRQMIERQLERLTPEEQRMIETASVIGGEFTIAIVAAGLDEQLSHVEVCCEGLAKRGQFLQMRETERLADGTVSGQYRFLHALYPQVLYERLAPMQRVRLHRRIGEWEAHAHSAQSGEKAAELAMHFERGQDYQRAVHYCYQAGQHARQRFATVEASQHFRHGLALLIAIPEGRQREEHELSLLLALGLTVWAVEPELGAVYTRASTLALQLDLPLQRFLALDGLVRWHLLRGEFQYAREIGEQSLVLTQDLKDPVLQIKASVLMALILCQCGEPRAAYDLTGDALAQYDALPSHAAFSQYGQDPKAGALSNQALSSWLLGYPEQARQQSLAALECANTLTSPVGIILARASVTIVQQCSGVSMATYELVETWVALASEHGSRLWEGVGRTVWGWHLVTQGQRATGWEQLERGERALRAIDGKVFRAYTLALLADAYRQSEQVESGLAAVREALTHVEQTGERWWEAELHRLRGELMLAQFGVRSPMSEVSENQKVKGRKPKKLSVLSSQLSVSNLQPLPPNPKEMRQAAEGCFLKAIDIARSQQAKSLELRAVMSLVRLRLSQAPEHGAGRTRAEAHNMLIEIYNWFTEGFDTADLQEAKALIEKLSQPTLT